MFAKKLKVGLVLSALVTFGLSGVAWAQPQQETPQQPEQRAGEVEASAQQALGNVYAFNQAVGEFGLLGINRADSDDVRDLANTIYERAQQANSDLMEQANQLDIPVAGTEPAKQAVEQTMQRIEPRLQELQGLSGQEFDQQYMQIVVQAHERAVSDLQQARQRVQRAELQQAIEERLSTVEDNLEQARELQEQVRQEQQQQQQQQQM